MTDNQYKIGVIGIGFVGSAIVKSLCIKGYELDKKLFIYDKFKNGGVGTFESTLECDFIFLALPTVYDDKLKSYDKSPIYDTCEKLKYHNYNGGVIIKSTVEPETCEKLSEKYNLNVINNPEFLTAKTAFHDFHNQKHIVLGKTKKCSESVFNDLINFYGKTYPNAEISTSNSTESELMKISVNCFYATKIQFMNEIYLLSESMDTDYNKVKDMMIKNGWINPMHTIVPGTDGKLSYGGLCFPKDTNALLNFMKNKKTPHSVLESVVGERNMMRNDNDNIKN